MKNDASDDDDIMRHMYIFSIGNSIIRKFNFCSRYVKLKLFQTYCSNIYTGHL